jgi:hypothetical protein
MARNPEKGGHYTFAGILCITCRRDGKCNRQSKTLLLIYAGLDAALLDIKKPPILIESAAKYEGLEPSRGKNW